MDDRCSSDAEVVGAIEIETGLAFEVDVDRPRDAEFMTVGDGRTGREGGSCDELLADAAEVGVI